MSRLSIYETSWIDLVFENRNKDYGAYQLRRESVKSSLTALFMGLLFIASIGTITTVVHYLNPEVIPAIPVPEWEETVVHLTDVDTPRPQDEAPAQAQSEPPAVQTPITQPVFRDPVIVSSNQAAPDVPVNTDIKNTVNTSAVEGNGATEGNGAVSSGNGTSSSAVAGPDPASILNTAVLDKMPEFPGGIEQFYKYVGNNFEKPEIDAFNSIKIYVYFVIERDGSMTDIQVKRDPGYGLSREAVRVLKSLKTKWNPGMYNGKAVRTAYNLPIVIQIN